MHFRSAVTDATALQSLSNIRRRCRRNQVLHEYGLIIYIRCWITAAGRQRGSVLCSRRAAEPYITGTCPLHTQALTSLHLLLSWTNCWWIYWNNPWSAGHRTHCVVYFLYRNIFWLIRLWDAEQSAPIPEATGLLLITTWINWDERMNYHRNVDLSFHAEVLDQDHFMLRTDCVIVIFIRYHHNKMWCCETMCGERLFIWC